MSTVSYQLGNNKIEMEIVSTDYFRQEPVYDRRGNYLYTRYELSVHCWYNPKAMSYRRGGQTVTQIDGVNAPRTSISIRHILQNPRGTLIYSVDNTELLKSPRTGDVTDARAGPTPLHTNVEEVHGEKTFKVHWVVECYISDCEEIVGSTAPILVSHEWTQTSALDTNYYEQIVTKGRAVFDMSRIESNVPDDYRAWFLPAVPKRWKLIHQIVNTSDDGTTAEYIVIHKEMRIAHNVRNIANIECNQVSSRKLPDVVLSSQAGISTIFNGVQTVGQSVAGAFTGGAGAAMNAPSGPNIVSMGINITRAMSVSVPQLFHHITTRVYGTREAHFIDLDFQAWRMMMFRRSLIPNINGIMYKQEHTQFHDVANGVAAYEYLATSNLVGGIANIVAPNSDLFNISNHCDDNGRLRWEDLESADGGGKAPRDRNSRGHSMYRIISQQLSGECERPSPHRVLRPPTSTSDPHV